MGSGETAPTMVKVHRSVVERLGPGRRARAAARHAVRVPDQRRGDRVPGRDLLPRQRGCHVGGGRPAPGRATSKGPAVTPSSPSWPPRRLVFAGPGSPTYALRQWQGTARPALLAEKLALGGALTFASAAALTLGAVTVPVYEVYKVGEDPRWVPGPRPAGRHRPARGAHPPLRQRRGRHPRHPVLLPGRGAAGRARARAPRGRLRPRRRRAHRACASTSTPTGLGGGPRRGHGPGPGSIGPHRGGRDHRPGSPSPELAAELASGRPVGATRGPGRRPADRRPGSPRSTGAGPWPAATPTTGHRCWAPSGASKRRSAPRGAPRTSRRWWRRCWRSTTSCGRGARTRLQSDALDRGRASLRAMVAELGELAALGARDPAGVVGPFVELALAPAGRGPRDRRFADADAVRDGSSPSGSRSTTPPTARPGGFPTARLRAERREGPC